MAASRRRAVESPASTRSSTRHGPTQVDRAGRHRPDVAPGEFVSLIGPSGCGKSHAAAADRRPDRADRRAPSRSYGKPAAQARLDQDYGIAFQQAGLLEWRTVAANIELPLELHGVGQGASAAARARGAARARRAGRFAGALPGQLSGGMQQRVAIARALAEQPAAAADGRAVRRPRRDDPRAHAGRAAADLRARPAPRSCSSPTRSPRPCSCRDRVVVMSPRPGPDHRRSSTSSLGATATERHRARTPTFFDDDHRGARGAARRRTRPRRAARGVGPR